MNLKFMPSLRVLLVDGDNVFRTAAQRALTRQGYFVVPAANCADALALLTKDQADVVVTQVALPEGDALEIVRTARAKTPAPPVILMADARTISQAVTGVREGAFDYILTPLDDLTRLAWLIDRAAPRVEAATTQGNSQIPRAEGVAPREDYYRPFLEAATSGADESQLLSILVSQVAQLTHAAQVIVLLTQGDTQLRPAAWHGFVDRAEAGRAYVQGVGEETGWQIATGRDAVWRELPLEWSDDAANPLEYLGIPIRRAEHVLGCVISFPSGPREIVESSAIETTSRLSEQAALALELARAETRVGALNPTDSVTGLLSRDQFFAQADREFRRSWRYGQPIAAMQLDIDDFGRLHVLLGATAGDRVLYQVATASAPRIRNVDLMGRIDTDSIGVLLVMATRVNALKVGERLRRSIAEIEISVEDDTWQVTASIGIATYPRPECTSVQDLFTLAERATRAAKKAGRNRVEAV